MKRELMTDIMQQMLPYIDNAQLNQLRLVMEQTLFCYEVTDAGVIWKRTIVKNLYQCLELPNWLATRK